MFRAHRHAPSVAAAAILLLTVVLAARPASSAEASPEGPGFPPYPGKQPLKEADRTTVAPGGTIIWTITIFNDFFGEDATVDLSDDVPDPGDFVPPAPVPAFDARVGGDIVSLPPMSTFVYTGDILSVSSIEVPGRSSLTIKLKTRVLASAADGTLICNRAYTRFTVTSCAGSPPLCGEKTYDSETHPTATTNGPTCVTVSKPKPIDVRPTALPAPLSDSCPANPSFPAPDGAISPGEQVVLKLPIQNVGGNNASGTPTINGTLAPGTGYTIVGAATSPYATTGTANVLLANGANVGTNSNDFIIKVDPRLPCPGNLSLSLQVSNITGGPYTVSYTLPVTACQPRCLAVAPAASPAVAQDECAINPPGPNRQMDPGDAVLLQLPLVNAGPDDLRGLPTLNATLSINPPVAGVSVSAGAATYGDLAVGIPVTNTPDFKLQLADTLACGTSFTARLSLTNAETGSSYNFDYPFTIPSGCTPCKITAVCAASAEAKALGKTRLCPGETVDLDAGTSTLKDCSGTRLYQWFEGVNPLPAETLPTFGVPTTLMPGMYSYAVQVSCSTDANCTSRSSPVDIQVDPQPLVVRRLLAVKAVGDVVFFWNLEPTATGGYHSYRTGDKTQIPTARLGNPNVSPVFQTLPDPTMVTEKDTGAVPGMPANPNLLHYQVVAACSNQSTEGPN